MKLNCSKANISDYQFLRLLLSNMSVLGYSPIIKNHELEKKLYYYLYYYYDDPGYHFLFEDIMKKESIDGNNYVDLSVAFQTAYTLGILTLIRDSFNEVKSVNLISKKEAEEIVLLADQKQVEAINDLCMQMSHKRCDSKSAKILKK